MKWSKLSLYLGLTLLLGVFLIIAFQDSDPKTSVFRALWSSNKARMIIEARSGQNVGVYLDGEFLGDTPLRLTYSDFERLKLPDPADIPIAPGAHWCTWDLHRGQIAISPPSDRYAVRGLSFRDEEGKPLKLTGIGMSNPETTGKVQRLSVKFSPRLKKRNRWVGVLTRVFR